MALTVTMGNTSGSKHGAQIMCDRDAFMVTGTIQFDTSYASAGESFDLSGYFNKVLFVGFDCASGGFAAASLQGTYLVQYDYAATVASGKVNVFGGGADTGGQLDELAVQTDLSGFIVHFFAIGY